MPFPLPAVEDERVSAVRVATCGLALQSCPTKEALAELPLAELRPAELAALSLVEGEVAMAWAIEQLPGARARSPRTPADASARDDAASWPTEDG